MLCADYWSLHPKEQRVLWNDNSDWIAQQKLNGVRLILHFIKDVGVFVHSRQVSEHTYRRIALTSRLLFRDFKPAFTATVDAEAICDKLINTSPYTPKGGSTKSSLHSTTALFHLEPEASLRLQREQDAPLMMNAFDMVRWQDKDLRRKKLFERLAYMKEFRDVISSVELAQWFEFIPVVFQNKREFYEKIISAGAEGCVLKNLNSRYEDSTSRNRFGWVKIKKRLELDAFVSGFEQGRPRSKWSDYVASLLFSVNTETKPRLIAKVSNLTWHLRKALSNYDPSTGKVSLDINSYGKVAHLVGLELSQRAFRLVHPRIEHWRKDLTDRDCLYSTNDLGAVRMGSLTPLARVITSEEV
jgi:hypothetical protein